MQSQSNWIQKGNTFSIALLWSKPRAIKSLTCYFIYSHHYQLVLRRSHLYKLLGGLLCYPSPPPVSLTLPPFTHTGIVFLHLSTHQTEIKDIRSKLPKAISNWILILINCHLPLTWVFYLILQQMAWGLSLKQYCTGLPGKVLEQGPKLTSSRECNYIIPVSV